MIGSGFPITSCQERDKNGKIVDTPTSGQLKIAVDESLRPLLEAEVDTFMSLYQYASVQSRYGSEADAIDALLKDSVKLAIITRKLTKEESEALAKMKIYPRQTKVAKDGIAIILNKTNGDSLIQFDQFKEIISGKITQWNQLDPKSNLGVLEVVFDHPQSGIIRFLKDSVFKMEHLPKNFYGVNSNKEVVDYVSKKPNAIGLIGVSWISDRDDSTTNQFLQSIRVAHVSRSGEAVQPYQAYIANGQYPLRRDVYMISREFRAGLGLGFTSFVAGEKGQRIVLKLGMVPATLPVRLVEITKKKFQ